MTADFVATNGRIYTVNPTQPWASAVAVREGVIAYVGDDEGAKALIGADTDVVDLGGRLVLPGFVESHVHILLGSLTSSGLQLDLTDTVEDVQRKVRQFAAAHPERPAVFGCGYHADMFDEAGPHRSLLDAALPEVPVILLDHTLHGGWANSRALEVTGITDATADPLPSAYGRDTDHTPSGALKGAGASLPVVLATGAVVVDAVKEAIADIVAGMSAFGFTAAFDMGNPIATEVGLDALLALDAEGRLPLRVSATTMINTPEMAKVGIAHQRRHAQQYRTAHIWFDTVKIVGDSVINNQTAAMLEPYLTTGERGSLYFSREVLARLVRDAAQMGHGVVMHAIGGPCGARGARCGAGLG